MTADDNGTFLSPEQVARECGLSRRADYRAIERGELARREDAPQRACRAAKRAEHAAGHPDGQDGTEG